MSTLERLSTVFTYSVEHPHRALEGEVGGDRNRRRLQLALGEVQSTVVFGEDDLVRAGCQALRLEPDDCLHAFLKDEGGRRVACTRDVDRDHLHTILDNRDPDRFDGNSASGEGRIARA